MPDQADFQYAVPDTMWVTVTQEPCDHGITSVVVLSFGREDMPEQARFGIGVNEAAALSQVLAAASERYGGTLVESSITEHEADDW